MVTFDEIFTDSNIKTLVVSNKFVYSYDILEVENRVETTLLKNTCNIWEYAWKWRHQDLQHLQICASHPRYIHLAAAISFSFSLVQEIFTVIDKYQPNVVSVTLDAIVNKLH